LRQIAHMRMAYTKKTYKVYKDARVAPEQDKMADVALIRIHMKMCIKHYHALLPQLDLIATQWGVDLADTLSLDDLGSLRSEGSKQKGKEKLDQQLRSQVSEARLAQLGPQLEPGPSQGPASAGQQSKGKSSISTETTEEMIRIKNHVKEEVRKRRQTEELLSKAEEDNRLLQRQLKTQGAPTTLVNPTQYPPEESVIPPPRPLLSHIGQTDSGRSSPRSYVTGRRDKQM
jgi:hypothetical protein